MPSQPPLNWHAFVPYLLNEIKAHTVAEVGVWKGELSEAIVTQCPQVERLYLIDPWQLCYGRISDGRYAVVCAGQTQAQCDAAKATTLYKMGRYKDRVRVLEKPSLEAAQGFEDQVLDAVLIDALHFEPYVSQDIASWFPKLRVGGLMIGDDYGPYYPGVEVGVRKMFGEQYQVWGLAERATWWATKEAACLVNG